MDLLHDGFFEALELVTGGDALVFAALWRSVWISSLAVALATSIGLPLGVVLAEARGLFARGVIVLSRAGMALPTVFVGLVCFAVFSRRGPLGGLDLLYTPWAIVIGEMILATPIVLSLTHAAVSSLDPLVSETSRTLGAGRPRRWLTLLNEARIGIMLAVLTAFARCITELGIAMMVGGNIKERTRTLATATALETGRGELARGLAMGSLLVVLALVVTLLIGAIARERKR